MREVLVAWWIKEETKARIEKLGKYGETQDQVLNRVLDEFERKQ